MNKLKIFSILIVLGAILSGIAPFIHMLFPKESMEIINSDRSDFKSERSKF